MASNTYDEVMRVLSNVRSIRAFVREHDYELLLEAHEKLGVALEERKEEYAAEKLEREAREVKRQELLALIESEGFDIGQLLGNETQTGKRKSTGKSPSKRAPKYKFTEDGETRYWSGVGRKPRPIAQAIANGGSLDDFLIADDQQRLDV